MAEAERQDRRRAGTVARQAATAALGLIGER